MDASERRSNRPRSRQSLAHVPSRTRSDSFDRQNVTADLSVLDRSQDAKSDQSKKRTRGKSLGPGGLEALKETSGNADKTITSFQPRSILKPAIPLTPPKHIPSFDELRKKNTAKATSPSHSGPEDLLIDFSTPAPIREGATEVSVSGMPTVTDPFSPTKNVSKEQGQENEASDDEQETKRKAEKQAILDKRAARRKSMANRRVSFAPEATLHTWSVMELQEDSTTSSASNSTRRQSSLTASQSPAPRYEAQAEEPPSTPPEQREEPMVKASPAHQRDLHQKKRRRSSMSVEMDISEDEVYSSSPSGDVTTNSSPVRVEDSIDSDSDDDDGDTAMSMDDTTSHTIGSQESSTQSSLDERLRQAAQQAGTRGIGYDEHGDDLSMELADGTVTSAFQPWAQSKQRSTNVAAGDQENINPFSSAQQANPSRVDASDNENNDDYEDTDGMTMDMTQAVGRIMPSNSSSSKPARKSVGNRRRSSTVRRRSAGNETNYGDETMDFTTIGGGILSHEEDAKDQQVRSDDDVTMEFTTAVGNVQTSRDRRSSSMSINSEGNDTMDMTAAVGGILATIEEHTEPQTDAEDDRTAAMDITRAGGQIIAQMDDEDSVLAEQQIQNEMNEAAHTKQLDSSLQRDGTIHHLTSVTSETGSPSLALKPRLSARSKSGSTSRSTTPKSAPRASATKTRSSMATSTPEKQLTPVPQRIETPEKTPLGSHVSQRSASPRKLFQAEIKARASPASARKSPGQRGDPLFALDNGTGQQTPKYVLHAPKPHQHLRRRSSGVGIDKEGFGSPRVTELLDRRESIGDAAPNFRLETAKKNRIRFEDPQQLEHQIDAERAEEERRESGRFVMEREADGHQDENATLQLKDLIDSMTPKKSRTAKLKGRKSLAVGSAKGLLGKRPAELDDDGDDDDDGDHTPKRLKAVAREASPVKAVHLPKPPSKEETTGRLTRAQQLALNTLGGNHTPRAEMSPPKRSAGPSPQQVGRFRDAAKSSDHVESFEGRLDNVIGAVDPDVMQPRANDATEERISLQEFLNMTNIHFIELSTTKRRHTMAQSLANQPAAGGKEQSTSLASSFVAATTTLPLLELYQHATRELKSYISSGRKIVRSIEAETLAEQPPLFREYIEARPDVKMVMDNQFRNGKTNARLQSKEGWYTWRSQLVDGLRAGLEGIKTDMDGDVNVLADQQASLDDMLPSLSSTHESLQHELESLQNKLQQLESIDQEVLKEKRSQLEKADNMLNEKLEQLDALQKEMREKEEILSQAAELKTEMHDQIAEADRVREEYRGWPAKDVLNLKAKVDEISSTTGWSLTAAEDDTNATNDFGIALTLSYLNDLRLYFHPSAFRSHAGSQRRRSGRVSRVDHDSVGPISLSHFVPMAELPTEQRFFLQLIQNQLHATLMTSQAPVQARILLETVSKGWDLARKITREIQLLNHIGVTSASIQNDETLAVTLMLVKSSSRIDIEFNLQVTNSPDEGWSIAVDVQALAVYGTVLDLLDASRTKKVQIALSKEVESNVLGDGAFAVAVQAFEAWHNGQAHSNTRSAEVKSAEVKPISVPVKSIEQHTPPSTRVAAIKRSPLATKKANTVQKKALPIPTSRQIPKPVRDVSIEKHQEKDKENFEPPAVVYGAGPKPAITPEMQEAMMQHTPIKRIGALRRSPIGGNGY